MTSWEILRGFLSIASGRAGGLLLAVVITPVLVRLLGSGGYGEYAFVLSAYGLLMVIVNGGVDAGLRKYIIEEHAESQWQQSVFGFFARVAFALAITVSLALFVLLELSVLESVLEPPFRGYFYLLCLLIVTTQWYYVVRSGLMGLKLEYYSEPLDVAREALFGLSAISLIIVGYGVSGALYGHVIATAVIGTAGFAVLRRRIPLTSVFSSPPESIHRRELLSFNLLSVVLTLLMVSLYHVDILLVQLIVGSEQTGYYRAALVIAEFVWFFPIAIQILFFYSFSEMWSKQQYRRITALSSRVTRYTLLLTVLLTLGLAALADSFVPLYFGPEFSAAVTPLLILLPGVIGFAVTRPMFAISQGKNEAAVRLLIGATGVSALLNLVLNLVLIPRYGMVGAAASTSLGYGSMVFLHTGVARRIGFDPVADLRFDRVLLTAAIAAVPIFGLSALIDSDLLSLLVVPPVGLAVYAVAAFRSGAISVSEVSDIIAIVPDSLGK
ncbi:flippase [Salinadaptatus halalkaliphilus]|uniref:Flippase n=1 Tax=Salinadaptatus halalkaliphilus TaxID=2419781 RepID=A0A4S3TPB3_9EURY|nr:polysaccharide biosynthesis C-terminal domain-containing protein [Salinadaptatus halalkaliphilus]THE64438.1 flippase [Salinadaptatus halalkaliphilus]